MKIFEPEDTYLQCIHCGYKTDLLEERKFRCPKCNDLYDVRHNMTRLTEWTKDCGLRSSFDRRSVNLNTGPLFQSGVWRFQELIMPKIPLSKIITLGEGIVPIVPAGSHLKKWIGGDIDLWIILEGMSPTGSFKDFGMTVLISIASVAGVKTIVCASTGDTSASVAAYAAKAGMKCVVILPKDKITKEQLLQVKLFGALVILLPCNFDGCMRIVQDLIRHHGAYPANSLNPCRIEGHQATVFLTAQFFGWQLPDIIAVPIGNGSNSSSIGKGMRLLEKLHMVKEISRILGCQAEAANPLTRSWFWAKHKYGVITAKNWRKEYKEREDLGETTATAAHIGKPVSKDRVISEITYSKGAMEIASEKDLNEAVMICAKDGIFVCPQTGIALAGVKNAVERKWIKKGKRVVVVSTATGMKFTKSAAQYTKSEVVEVDKKNCNSEYIAGLIGS